MRRRIEGTSGAAMPAAGRCGRSRSWLEQAARLGCWVTVVSSDLDGPFGVRADRGPVDGPRLHRVARLRPGAVLRALDEEAELGEWDLVVGLDRRTHALLQWLPAVTRSGAPVVAVGPEAHRALGDLTAAAIAGGRPGVSAGAGAS
jgi:hypothetical protein